MKRRVTRSTVSTEDFQEILAGRERELITIIDIDLTETLEVDPDEAVLSWSEYNA